MTTEKRKQQQKEGKARIAVRNRAYIAEHLRNNPCIDCGETDIEVLQFDHKESIGAKGYRVYNYIGCSISRLQQEIDKCDVRCANCHVRRTRKQMGWFRETEGFTAKPTI